MGVDVLKTVAILDASNYLTAAERMARATDKVGDATGTERYTAALTVAGGLMTSISAKAIATAASFNQQRAAFGGLLGDMKKGRELFDNLAQFTMQTPYRLRDWTQGSQTLLAYNVQAQNLIGTLRAVGDAEAAAGRSSAVMQRAMIELGEMNADVVNRQYIRNLTRDGIPAAKLLRQELHLTADEVARIGEMHIPGQIGVAAIVQGIEHSNLAGGMARQMDTLNGSITSLQDAWSIFLDTVGQGPQAPLTHLVTQVTDLINQFERLPKIEKDVISGIALWSGPVALGVSGLLKLVGAWNGISSAKNLAAIAARTERDAEVSKLPVLETEAAMVETATTRWSGLAGALSKYGLLLGRLYLAGDAIRTVGDAFTNPANTTYNAGWINYKPRSQNKFAAFWQEVMEKGERPFQTLGSIPVLGMDGNSARGFENWFKSAYSLVAQSGDKASLKALMALHPSAMNLERHWNDASIAGPKQIEALAGRINAIVESSRHYSPAQDAIAKMMAQQDADSKALLAQFSKDKSKYFTRAADTTALTHAELAADREETLASIAKIAYDQAGHAQRRVLKTSHGKHSFSMLDEASEQHAAYNKHRLLALRLIDQEIAALQRHAKAIDGVAKKQNEWLSTERKVLGLMQKRQELSVDQIAQAHSKSSLERIAAIIVGGQGLDEAEILRRTGIGRKYFASLNGPGHHLPPNPMAAALSKIAAHKQEIKVEIHAGEKLVDVVSVKVENNVAKMLADVLTHSGYRPALAGQ